MARVSTERTYLRALAGIVVSYALIIGFGNTRFEAPTRVLLLGYLIVLSLQLYGLTRWHWWVGGSTLVVFAVAIGLQVAGDKKAAEAVVGAISFVAIGFVIGSIAARVARRARPDTTTVLGVLNIYLLLALLFSAVHQFFAAFITPYVNGVQGPPTVSDLLYFSVITITTVGFGDITPAAEVARAVTVIEALTGQLYLVSVVAAVVGGWRAAAGRGQ